MVQPPMVKSMKSTPGAVTLKLGVAKLYIALCVNDS